MGPVANEEFVKNVVRGGELLAAGKVIEAREYLERAHRIQPKNEKGQNLLGLTYFKLGLYERAAEIYEALVRENPVDPTLRVNLGLVYLKTQALPRAIREFEAAVDLSPEHKKAHNYLGLALAQVGRFEEARAHFIEAGSDSMAEKMERALTGETGVVAAQGQAAPPSQQAQAVQQAQPAELHAQAGPSGLGPPVQSQGQPSSRVQAEPQPQPRLPQPSAYETPPPSPGSGEQPYGNGYAQFDGASERGTEAEAQPAAASEHDAEEELPWANDKDSDWSVHFGEESSSTGEAWVRGGLDTGSGGSTETDPEVVQGEVWDDGNESGKILSVSRNGGERGSSEPARGVTGDQFFA